MLSREAAARQVQAVALPPGEAVSHLYVEALGGFRPPIFGSETLPPPPAPVAAALLLSLIHI